MGEFRIGAHVKARDGGVGRLARLVVNGAVGRVTHLVLSGRPERVVPVEWVAYAITEEVVLSRSRSEVHDAPTVHIPANVVLHAGEHPEIGRRRGDEELPVVVAGSDLDVVDADGNKVGHVDTVWVRDDDPGEITDLVVLREGGLRLDQVFVVPLTHVYLAPTPEVRLDLTDDDIDIFPHQPARPGAFSDSDELKDRDVVDMLAMVDEMGEWERR